MFKFLRFSFFRRPRVATFAEHERFTEEVVELFRMPVEEELCAPEPSAAVAAPADEPMIAEQAPVRSGHLAA